MPITTCWIECCLASIITLTFTITKCTQAPRHHVNTQYRSNSSGTLSWYRTNVCTTQIFWRTWQAAEIVSLLHHVLSLVAWTIKLPSLIRSLDCARLRLDGCQPIYDPPHRLICLAVKSTLILNYFSPHLWKNLLRSLPTDPYFYWQFKSRVVSLYFVMSYKSLQVISKP